MSEWVDFGTNGNYCKMCHRKLLTTELTPTEREKSAENQEWDVPSVRRKSTKSAGERGTIDMHN
jgi:hypothetical protein